MSIIQKNVDAANANRQIQYVGTSDFLEDGLKRALAGEEGGVNNHKARWEGYSSSGVAQVSVYGKIYKINAVHGYKGIPRGAEVVLRVAKNYLTADFQ